MERLDFVPATSGGVALEPPPADHVDRSHEALDTVVDLRALDHPAASVAASRNPGWLVLANTWHRAERHALPVTLDVALCALLASVVGALPYKATAIMAASFLASGLDLGLWKERSDLEVQGVAWYLRRLVPAAALAAATVRFAAPLSDGLAGGVFASTVGALLLARILLWQLIGAARRHDLGLRTALVVGHGNRIAQVGHRLAAFPETGLTLEAAYAPKPEDASTPEEGEALVAELLRRHPVDHIVLAAGDVNDPVVKSFLCFAPKSIELSLLVPLARLVRHVDAHLGDLGVLPVRLTRQSSTALAKRAFDGVIGSLLVLLASPVLLLTALAIRLDDGGPVIFRQNRVGKDGRVFQCWKFRSMVVGAEDLQAQYIDSNVHRSLLFKMDGDPRVTRVGAFIRRFSIDELPQLLMVVKGDMSLVGPRPLAVDPHSFDGWARVRHLVSPGCTGMWQVNGANALPYDDMVDLDLAYVATRSLGTDLRILFRTIPALLVRRDVH